MQRDSVQMIKRKPGDHFLELGHDKSPQQSLLKNDSEQIC